MLVSSNTCAWICERPVDMRKSIDALAVLVEPLFNIAKAGLNMAQLSAWLEGMPIARSSFKTVNAKRVS